jgi:hypothetical protein
MMVMNEEVTGLDRLCEMRNADTLRYDGWDKAQSFCMMSTTVDAHSLHFPVYILNNSTNVIHTTRQFQLL